MAVISADPNLRTALSPTSMEFAAFLFLLAVGSMAAQSDSPSQNIPILSYSNENYNNGSYKYSYKTGNGISVEEEGSLKNPGRGGLEAQTSRGKYSYTAPEGQVITVIWYADETGFHAKTTILPPEDDDDLTNKVFDPQSSLAGPMFRGR